MRRENKIDSECEERVDSGLRALKWTNTRGKAGERAGDAEDGLCPSGTRHREKDSWRKLRRWCLERLPNNLTVNSYLPALWGPEKVGRRWGRFYLQNCKCATQSSSFLQQQRNSKCTWSEPHRLKGIGPKINILYIYSIHAAFGKGDLNIQTEYSQFCSP